MPPPKTGEQLLRAAQQLAPLIREARAEIEQTRALPLALVSAMQAAGIFQMWLPLGLGAIHAPGLGRRPRATDEGYFLACRPDRVLLPEAATPADGL